MSGKVDKGRLVELCDIASRKARIYSDIVDGSIADKKRLELGELAGIMECLSRSAELVEMLIKEATDE